MQPRSVYVIVGFLAVVMVGIGVALTIPGVRNPVWSASANTISPVYVVIDWFKSKTATVHDKFSTLDDLEKEVAKLREENTLMATELSRVMDYESENTRLREALGFRTESKYKLLAAKVIDRDLSAWRSSIIINRGWMDDEGKPANEPKLEPDQPVVTSRGVVGRTGVVGRWTTEVVLIIDENCRISAEVEGNRARGIVRGASVVGNQKADCRITYVPKETPPLLNSRVLTSGLGGSFPQGLVIGTIRDAKPLTVDVNFGLYHEATIEPSVDLDDLHEVFVIVGSK